MTTVDRLPVIGSAANATPDISAVDHSLNKDCRRGWGIG